MPFFPSLFPSPCFRPYFSLHVAAGFNRLWSSFLPHHRAQTQASASQGGYNTPSANVAPVEPSLNGPLFSGGGGEPDQVSHDRRVTWVGVKKGNGPSKKGKAPSHLRGEATPLSQEEVKVSVDSDDDDG